ncbi:50S ribosomal protein L6 [Candidatus Purcelliella pentastirinorum]|uniref:50S ribosomal protein L6 n=1 Tax=Candidatus Purcelliella pentastirinorum TaxID=472834 RepID=UPI00237C22CD|nr:50S ribosomal protein L6 [Candidatus Purcelliella pentastirinorum]WDR80397.1 50S ribosomal protein L6 [Candidatus Purcelliella pentastirinorum]
MSRIAKAIVIVPDTLRVFLSDFFLIIEGDKGKLLFKMNKFVNVNFLNNIFSFSPKVNNKHAWACAGTVRSIVNSMVIGLTKGFIKRLQLVGVGYKAYLENNCLNMFLGYSHPIKYLVPKNVFIECPSSTDILLKSIDKQLVGQVSAIIRSYKKPEVYKGKGIRYFNETILIKEAKKSK